MTTSLPRKRLLNSITSVEGRNASSMTRITDSDGTGFRNPSWARTRNFFCLQLSYETSINSSWEGLTQRSSNSKQQTALRRLSSGSSLCQQNGSRHQGSMCWIYLKSATTLKKWYRTERKIGYAEKRGSKRCITPQGGIKSPYPTMRLEAIRSIMTMSCRCYPKSVWKTSA